MDKSWMFGNRISPEFKERLKEFCEYAKQFVNREGKVHCPCRKCANVIMQPINYVYAHCHDFGWLPGYTTWLYHGETYKRPRTTKVVVESGDEMAPVINDFLGRAQEEVLQTDGDDNIQELLSKLQQEVYPGCKRSSALKFLADLMHIKVLYKWPNESFDVLLTKLNEILPEGSNLPDSFYKAKALLEKLGLGYEKIDACPHDCAIYYKENALLQSCPVCKTSRYKQTKGNKIPHKVLRYFPLKSRLRRLYASRHTAKAMTWHKTGSSTDEDIMTHPSDGKEWKDFDMQHPDFAREPRNVRLSLATDGFNPFSCTSQTYSMWPVVTQVLNPAPWDCNSELYKQMSLLIPGPKSPGKDFDVYLRPLIDELQELWVEGVVVFDAATNTTFKMRVALMMTVNDFPARSYLSGWSGQGYKACPTCNDDTPSVRLTSKIGYVGHRRWLRNNHPMRNHKGFNGKIETLCPPVPKTTEEILQQINNLPDCMPGKHPDYGGRKIKRPASCLNWTKKSILRTLPYWNNKKLQHNLDVMHIDKKVCDSLLGTILCIEGKNKDTDKARIDLKNMNVRSELHLFQQGNKIMKPHAAFTLKQEDREKFCDFLKSVRFPDGFAGNLQKNVIGKGKLQGLKSHDCHVILQRLLPIGLRPFLRKDISDTITDLSDFFRLICARTLKVSELQKAKEKVLEILCKLEVIFPPAFFDILIHLIMHLPEEAIRGGPVHLRWMYPIERFLGKLKRYIRNRARPEGSIAEAYVANETLIFCSLYFSGNETKFNRPARNWVEHDDPSRNLISVFKTPFRAIGSESRLVVDNEEKRKIEWYVLQNCPEIDKYLSEHRTQLSSRCSRLQLDKLHRQEFPKWFYSKVKAGKQRASLVNDQVLSLAIGSLTTTSSYPSCVVNGVRFTTNTRDMERKTQNSGVAVKGTDGITFYGILENIYVVNYPKGYTVVLFKCKWFDTSASKKGVRVYKNRTSICTQNTWYDNEPFILASQAEQVFYIDDIYNGSDWKIVEHFQHRQILDAPNDSSVVQEVVIDETTHGNFQLFVELPPIESTSMCANDIEPHVATSSHINEECVSDGDEYVSSSGDDYASYHSSDDDNDIMDDDV